MDLVMSEMKVQNEVPVPGPTRISVNEREQLARITTYTSIQTML